MSGIKNHAGRALRGAGPAILGLVLGLSGCGQFGHPSGSSSLDEQLKNFSVATAIGKIGSGAAVASSTCVQASIPSALVGKRIAPQSLNPRTLSHNIAATHVGVFSIPPDSYWGSNLQMLSLVPIGADGAFSLPYVQAASANSVIMLVNKNASNPTELVAGFLGVPNGSGSSLISFPLDLASSGISLGNLDPSTSDATLLESSLTISDVSAAFGSTPADLERKALFDNGAKRVMNAFINDSSTGYSFKYYWYSREKLASISAIPSDPSQYAYYDGYGFEVNLPFDAATLSGLQGKTKTLSLYPPSSVYFAVSGTSSSADELTPLTSEDSMLSCSQISTLQDGQGNWIPTGIKLCFGDYIPAMAKENAKLFLGQVPQGMWAMSIDTSPLWGSTIFRSSTPCGPTAILLFSCRP